MFFVIVSPGRAGAFSRDFTTVLAPESRAFSDALKIEKLKAPLIPGPEGAVDTNDWCITKVKSLQRSGTEAIRTKIQPSKPKRKITNITNSQNTKRTYEPCHEKTNVCIICKTKDADQLRGNREADQRLCFRYIDSTIHLLSKSEISSI